MAVENIPPSPKGVTPKFFRVKPSTGAGGARRALAVLGNNNAQVNLRMAQSLLTISQEGFMKKWNFDPVKEVPLAPGRYRWAPARADRKKEMAPALKEHSENPIEQPMNITEPNLATLPPSVTSRVPDLHKASQDILRSDFIQQNPDTKQETYVSEAKVESCASKHIKTDESKQVIIPCQESILISTKIVPSPNPQMCITDFLRPQKRNASYLYDECKTSTPPIKKLRTLQ